MGSTNHVKRVPRGTVSGPVREYLEQHVGVDVSASEIADAIGREVRQVQTTVSNLRQQGMTILNAGGSVYRYMGDGRPKSDSLFRLVGTSKKDGSLILERDDGGLYRATEI